MTVAHGFGYCGDDLEGLELHNGHPDDESESQYIGDVVDWSHDHDWAIVEEQGSSDIDGLDNMIVDGNCIVNGHVSEDGVDYFASSSDSVAKYGQATCRTTGEITGEIVDSRCANAKTWIRTTTDATAGDSGAPHYRTESVGAGDCRTYIIGPHWRHTHADDDNEIHLESWAAAAYEINDLHEIEFGGSSC